jgi:beta-phosphoglucomutase-like phosphatase (HAD superfamily)
VVFDCDGLLLDTEALWTRAEVRLWAEHGKAFDADQKRLLVGTSGAAAGLIVEQLLDRPGEGAQLVRRLTAMALAEAERGPVEPMPGALDLLAALREAGIPVAVATNSQRAFLELCLAGAELLDAFDATVSATDVAAP